MNQNEKKPQTANPNEVKFRAIGIMADRNKDVRLSNTLVECKRVRAGSILSFGIDDATGCLIREQMMGVGNTHIIVCMVIHAAELENTMKELTAPAPAPGKQP